LLKLVCVFLCRDVTIRKIVVLNARERVGASEIGLLSTMGVGMPYIGVLSSGDEIIEGIIESLSCGQVLY